MDNKDRKFNHESPYHRLVVKFGTSLLTGGTDHLSRETMSGLVSQVAQLNQLGLELLIVSSGAIAAGRSKLGLTREHTRKQRGIPFKQVLASVGQSQLMNVYEQLFAEHSITVAQALLTRADLTDRAGYLNARGTLLALLELKVICIVNENDVVAVDELQDARFGDNDNLSAMVANLVDADLLLILSDIAGLYTADPRHYPEARLIPQVDQITAEIEGLVTGAAGNLGTGGMATKIEAAKLATASGVAVVIANGREPEIISRVAAGERIGLDIDHHDVLAMLAARERMADSGSGAAGRVDRDFDRAGCDHRERVIGHICRARFARCIKRRRSILVSRPADALQACLRALRHVVRMRQWRRTWRRMLVRGGALPAADANGRSRGLPVPGLPAPGGGANGVDVRAPGFPSVP